MERRKRRRNTGRTSKHPSPDGHPPARSQQSQLIPALPSSALIRYLHKHRLLQSPLRPPPADPRQQLIEDYQRFALLVASPGPGNSASSISPFPSAVSSDSSSAGGPCSPTRLAHSPVSSSAFYRRLFSPADALGEEPQQAHEQPSASSTSSRQRPSATEPRDSLFAFDKALTSRVQAHHQQSFPNLLLPPSEPAPSSRSPDSPPAAEPLMLPLRNPAAELNHHHHLLLPLHPVPQSTPLSHHGFRFNVHRHHLPHPHPPPDHIRLIEDHVLPNFVYSIKTRGNALRPK